MSVVVVSAVAALAVALVVVDSVSSIICFPYCLLPCFFACLDVYLVVKEFNF